MHVLPVQLLLSLGASEKLSAAILFYLLQLVRYEFISE